MCSGSLFRSAFSTCSVRETSVLPLSDVVRQIIAFFQSSAHGVFAISVCFDAVLFTPMAFTWHAFSHAPQYVQKSRTTSIFLSSGMIHAFDGHTLKHPWQPTGSQPLSLAGISSISPSNGFVTFAA